jgi:hypothetical protein
MADEIYQYFFDNWPQKIEHNSKKSAEKEYRYSIGTSRLAILREFARPFAKCFLTDRAHYAVFLHVFDESDRDFRMPEKTRCEYVCGKKSLGGEYILFAYLFFNSINEAIVYAQKKGMSVEGEWNEQK